MKRIINDELEKELSRINKKHKDGNVPSGTIARLVKKISRRETRAGGPYKNDAGLIDINLNKQIFLFLEKINVSLPELNNF